MEQNAWDDLFDEPSEDDQLDSYLYHISGADKTVIGEKSDKTNDKNEDTEEIEKTPKKKQKSKSKGKQKASATKSNNQKQTKSKGKTKKSPKMTDPSTMFLDKGISFLTKYTTVDPKMEGTKLRTPPVMVDWLPPFHFDDDTGEIKQKAKNLTKVKKVIALALMYLRKPEKLKDETYLERVQIARKFLAEDSNADQWGFSILDLVGVDTRLGYPRFIISWLNTLTNDQERKIVLPSILKEETFWMKNTLSLIGTNRIESIMEMMERFMVAFSENHERQKDKMSIITECWPTWEDLLNKHKESKQNGQGPLMLSVVRSKRMSGRIDGKMTTCLLPPFPMIHMPITFGKYEVTKSSVLKQIEREKKRASFKERKSNNDNTEKRKGFDPKTLLPPQPKQMKGQNINSAFTSIFKPKQPWINKRGNSLDLDDQLSGDDYGTDVMSNERTKERASQHVVQQIKSFLVVGPQHISDSRRKLVNIKPDLQEKEKLRQKISDVLSKSVDYKQKQLLRGAVRHFKKGRTVLKVESLKPTGVGAFLQNPLSFTQRFGDKSYNISGFEEYKGPCFLTAPNENGEDQKRKKTGTKEKNALTKKKAKVTKPSQPTITQKKKSKEEVTKKPREKSQKRKETTTTTVTPPSSPKPVSKTPEDKILKEKDKTVPEAPLKKKRPNSSGSSNTNSAGEKGKEPCEEEDQFVSSPPPTIKRKSQISKKKREDEEKALSPSPSWDSFDSDDNKTWSKVLQVYGKGQADANGRISNFFKILKRNSVRKEFAQGFDELKRKIVGEISSKVSEIRNKEEVLITNLETTRTPKETTAKSYVNLLISQTLGGYYLQQMFDDDVGINLQSAVSVWIEPTCSALDILRSPHRTEKKQLTRFFTGSQIIVLESFDKPSVIMVSSKFDPELGKHVIILPSGSLAMFSRDMVVNIVGKKGVKAIPGDKKTKRPSLKNDHEKTLFISYFHVMPKRMEGLGEGGIVKKKRKTKQSS